MKNNKLILKFQQRFRIVEHVFTEEVNKTALIPDVDAIKNTINRFIRKICIWNEQGFSI